MFGSTPYKQGYRPEEYSTGFKQSHDLAESQRQYNALLDENAQLREQVRRRNMQPSGKEPIYSPEELERISESLVSGPPRYADLPAEGENIVIEKICPYMLGERSNMAAYNLQQQNRYLVQKIELLRNEYERQNRRIQRYSTKMREHTGCVKDCYERKYYELLRITSPQ